ncbi:HAMP domain-containing histidine kinase [Actinoallomurus purpureus]|uniref:sensor histidine kinase n=1 Tax=Actinoallomurus purpureus TaxID=478114 RepID=UPI002092321A|nr:HAMP domain-containing sensor histidine kinase [Actinoallomurus purpureus]MCO6007702.1 HAMP domain-containing histidine kinase [Actinoallomurus purpureus]
MISGLRGRLFIAFVAACLASTALVAGIGYVFVRRAILQRAQDAVLIDTRETLAHNVPGDLTTPVPERTLRDVAAALVRPDWYVVATDGTSVVATGEFGLNDVPIVLATHVANGLGLYFQRVVIHGAPWLVTGTRVQARDGQPLPLTVVVFASLAKESADLHRIQSALIRAGALTVVLAVALAALLGRSVLRPLRRLARAARLLGIGHLAVRVDVRGRDELAAVARIFNETAASLEYTVRELRRLEATARRFAADVSHELRTPIAAMTAVTDLLEEDAARLPSDTGTAARLVADQTRRLGALVEDLLEISRMDAGTADLTLDEVPLAELVRECVATRGWADRVVIEIPPGLRVRLDPRRFDVIIANLVANALRHGAPPVRVTARPGLEIRVIDRGPGIPDDVLPHVFDRFFKADPARPAGKGTGLGLAIAQANAALHGGRIEAANAPGGGAVFTVRIPA